MKNFNQKEWNLKEKYWFSDGVNINKINELSTLSYEELNDMLATNQKLIENHFKNHSVHEDDTVDITRYQLENRYRNKTILKMAIVLKYENTYENTKKLPK